MKEKVASMEKINTVKVALILGAALVVLSALAFTPYDSLEPDESIQHYLYSRYAMQHPELLLDPWQRPVFAVLSLPFTQFGFTAFRFFNIFLALGASYIGYLIAKKLRIHNAALVVVFILFSPLYFAAATSGLTETLFSFLLLLSLYLLMEEKYAPSLLIASFLPYSRQEGFVIIFILSLFLISRRKWRHIPLLLIGSLAMEVIAYLHNLDPLWLMKTFWENNGKYGHGSLLYFVRGLPSGLGVIQTTLLVIGVSAALRDFTLGRFKMDHELQPKLLLLICAVSLIVIYSVLWWCGLFAALNLLRYINTIIPILSIFALLGLNAVLNLVKKNKSLYLLTLSAVIIFIVVPPLKKTFAREHQAGIIYAMNEAASWSVENLSNVGPLVVCDNLLAFHLQSDPFNENKFKKIWGGELHLLPFGSVVVWNVFCDLEWAMPFEFLSQNSTFRLIKSIEAGGADQVHFFRKLDE